jgi:hypothetical protein
MNCPDVDRVLTAARGEHEDPALMGHVQECPKCASEFTLLTTLGGPAATVEPVPAHLVDRVMAALPPVRAPFPAGTPARSFDRGHSVLTFVMASSTAAVVSLLGGGGARPSMMLFASLVGFIAARLETRTLQ